MSKLFWTHITSISSSCRKIQAIYHMTPTRQWIWQNNTIRTTHSQVPRNEHLWRIAMGDVKRYPYFIRRTDLICLSLSISLHVLCVKPTKEEACCKCINASLNDSLQNKARGYMCPRIDAEIHCRIPGYQLLSS